MGLVARMDDIGRPAWLAFTVLCFVVFWPLGLATLAFLIGSGRMMGCWGYGGPDRWHRKMERLREKMERWQAHSGPHGWGHYGRDRGYGRGGWGQSSGNHAFDDYRADTLRRLEEEQAEFEAFLAKLRYAKDQAEFDQFMAERMRGAGRQEPPEAPAHE